jgi:dTDP-4-amino-4,6-dideoxygalactose transaminase
MVHFLDVKKITAAYQPEVAEALQRVANSGSFIRGEEVKRFEDAYAAFTGSKHCVGVGNGFDALKLIFKAWIVTGEIKEGDEVIVPANTYVASVLAVSDNRLVPVFVEPDVNTFNIDSRRIEEKITTKTRAILVVHLYGRNAMTDEIQSLADHHKLKVVEDNAQAAGCFWKKRRTGSLGHAAAHSFFPTKNLGALGDGGAVTTDDASLSGLIRTLGNYGSDRKGVNDVPGVNSRLDELQAAVLNVKLPRLDADNLRRRNVARLYLQQISNPVITLPSVSGTEAAEHVWHLFVVRTDRRDDFQRHLASRDIETLVHYPIPPHRQGAYKGMKGESLPITEEIHSKVLSLPLHPMLEEGEVQSVIEAVNGFSH